MTTGFPNGILTPSSFLGIFLVLEKESYNMGAIYISKVRMTAEVMEGPVPISGVHFPIHGL